MVNENLPNIPAFPDSDPFHIPDFPDASLQRFLPAEEKYSQDYFNGQTMKENSNPVQEDWQVYMRAQDFDRNRITPPSNRIFVVRRNGVPSVLRNSSQFFFSLSNVEVESIYAGRIDYAVKFSLASRLEHTGYHAIVSLGFRVSDPLKAVEEDSLKRDGYFRPVIFQTTREIMDKYYTKLELERLIELEPKDYLDINSELKDRLSEFFRDAGLELKMFNFNTQFPITEVRRYQIKVMKENMDLLNQLADSKSDFDMNMFNRISRLRGRAYDLLLNETTTRRRNERAEEGLDLEHKIKMKERAEQSDSQKQERETKFRLNLLEESRRLLADLERNLTEEKSFISKLMSYKHLSENQNIIFGARNMNSSDETAQMLKDYFDSILYRRNNPIDVEKLKAVRGLFSNMNFILRDGDMGIGEFLQNGYQFLNKAFGEKNVPTV